MTRSSMDGFSKNSTRRMASFGALVTGLSVLTAPIHAEDSKVNLKPLQVGASLSFGQMFNINDSLQEVPNFDPTVTLPYTSLWMIQNATYNERFDFSLGIAGTFWYPYPEDIGVGWTSYRTGGVAIAVAQGTYKLGDLDNPWMQISVGQQGYKYNPYAKNFGEYLFRSEAYPTTVRTGDWGAIDNAGAGIWGAAFKGNFLGGLLTSDFIINLSNERSPLHDLSFSNVTSVNVGKFLQIGGGVMLSRYLQIDPEKSHPKKANTGYFTWTAADQARLDAYIATKKATDPNFVTGSTDFKRKLTVGGADVNDSVLAPGDYWAASQRPLVKFVSTTGQADPTFLPVSKHDEIEYVNAKTILLMGRAAFDPKPLFGIESTSKDGSLYAEVGVIGLTNYPIYYQKLSERMPMMFGFYIPTVGWLDYLTVEVEQWKNPHMNSDFMPALFRELRPKSPNGTLPVIPSIADPVHDGAAGQDQYGIEYTDDDLKWTLTGCKSFGPWSIAAQYGKDHFRPLTGSFRPSYSPAATTSDASYYMVRLMVNL